jgi:ATP-binding cassette subfamily B (MDR/TAP) protein 1
VKSADTIIVMGEGKVLEHGSHEALILAKGPYSQFFTAQCLPAGNSDISGDVQPEKNEPTSHNALLDLIHHEKVKGSTCTTDRFVLQQQLSTPTTLQMFNQCLSYSKQERMYLWIGLAASVLSGSLVLGESIVFGHLVQLLKQDSSGEQLGSKTEFYSLMFFVLALVAFVAYSVSGSALGVVSERFVARIHDKSVRSILRQDTAWFSQHTSSPQHLMATLNVNTGALRGLSGSIIGVLLSAITAVAGGMLLAHIVAWKIAVVLLPAVPVMLAAGFLRIRVVTLAEERQQKAYVAAAALASEACKQIRTVASYGLENHFLNHFNAAIDFQHQKLLKFNISSNLFFAFSLAITYFVYALAYWWYVSLPFILINLY